jgi:hypothetical protein
MITSCAQSVDHADVIRYVQAQMEVYQREHMTNSATSDRNSSIMTTIPPRMQLQPCMRQAISSNLLRDALMERVVNVNADFETDDDDAVLESHDVTAAASPTAPSTINIRRQHQRGDAVLRAHMGTAGVVVWVARRPG